MTGWSETTFDTEELTPAKPNPRRAYIVVDLFERELESYTGAPYAVTVNSCTNALFLALTWERMRGGQARIRIPKHTYIGVLQSVINAGFEPYWNSRHNGEWQDRGWYRLVPYSVIDSARYLAKGMWRSAPDTTLHVCLSFHSAKQLPLGRGGAILTDDREAAKWFRAARMDGRPPGAPPGATISPAWHMPLPPDTAARGLDILSRWNDAGYSPPPLPATSYPDLSALYAPVAR